MKGLGNYRFQDQNRTTVERRPGQLLLYRGRRAVVRFGDGGTYSVPADGLKREHIEPKQRFVMVITRAGKKIQGIRYEPLAPPMPNPKKQVLPKVMVRDGKKLTTRR